MAWLQDRTAESHAGVLGQNKKIFFFFYIHMIGENYIMPEKHDLTAESHVGVLGQKKNFFSSFTYPGWDGGVILCLRNTIEQLNHMLGFLDRRIIFFLLLHTQDGGEFYYA